MEMIKNALVVGDIFFHESYGRDNLSNIAFEFNNSDFPCICILEKPF